MAMTNSSSISKLGEKGAHILLFPYPAQGHIIPLLDLAHHLATRGLTLTIVVTPKNLSLLSPLLSLHPNSVSPFTLPFPTSPFLPPGIENQTDLFGSNYFLLMMHALSGLYDPLLAWWTNHDSPPVAILSDMFLGWTQTLASRLQVPRLVFSPSGAFALSALYSLWRRLPKNHAGDEHAMVSFPEIPNCPKYPWWQISPIYRRYVAGDPVSEFIREGFLGDVASWGVVVNTFDGLEKDYLDHLKKDLGHNRVWAVGPLLPADPEKRGGDISDSAAKVLTWLDTCRDRSVVYVCFGSLAVLSNDQMGELALGLEKSGTRFVWCTKQQVTEEYGVVPPGFEDRTLERGRVVRGWAPQVSILRHRAVGAFLTHCGWNSVLESVAAGVPMLTWPMSADQFIDATLLVDRLGAAVRVCEGDGALPDSDELARLFRDALGEGQAARVRAAELLVAALGAVERGGTSDRDLGELVESFEKMCTR